MLRESEIEAPCAYPFEIDNRFSIMGYSTAVSILLLVVWLGLDNLSLESVVIYGGFTITFHLILEFCAYKRWMSAGVHTVLYEIGGMLIWITSFAYVATLLDSLRPLLLIGSFLMVNFATARAQVALATRVTWAVGIIYMFPAAVAWVLGDNYDFVARDVVLVLGFWAVAIHGVMVAKKDRPKPAYDDR